MFDEDVSAKTRRCEITGNEEKQRRVDDQKFLEKEKSATRQNWNDKVQIHISMHISRYFNGNLLSAHLSKLPKFNEN